MLLLPFVDVGWCVAACSLVCCSLFVVVGACRRGLLVLMLIVLVS